jgi:hypothetical protein
MMLVLVMSGGGRHPANEFYCPGSVPGFAGSFQPAFIDEKDFFVSGQNILVPG